MVIPMIYLTRTPIVATMNLINSAMVTHQYLGVVTMNLINSAIITYQYVCVKIDTHLSSSHSSSMSLSYSSIYLSACSMNLYHILVCPSLHVAWEHFSALCRYVFMYIVHVQMSVKCHLKKLKRTSSQKLYCGPDTNLLVVVPRLPHEHSPVAGPGSIYLL
jgi:hypothetical protein